MGVGDKKSALVEREIDDIGHVANVAGMTVTVVQCMSGEAMALEWFQLLCSVLLNGL